MIEALISIYRAITGQNNSGLFMALGEFYISLRERFDAIEARLAALEPAVEPEPQPAPPPITDPAIFMDNFDYPVTRNENPAEFLAAGWDNLKALNAGDSGALGYIYTVDTNQIPSYQGPDLGKWLAMEGVPNGGQTDFYLQAGAETTSQRFPAALEINMTLCIGEGEIDSDKFVYPSPDGQYPVSGGSYPWLIDIRSYNFGWLGGASYERPRDVNGDCYLMIEGSAMHWAKAAGDGPWKMMHTNPVPIRRGIPTDVRIRIDTSGTRNVGGTIDVDLREHGGEWVNVIHAHHGENVDGELFEWPLTNMQPIQTIRIPTTQDTNNIKYLNHIRFGEIA